MCINRKEGEGEALFHDPPFSVYLAHKLGARICAPSWVCPLVPNNQLKDQIRNEKHPLSLNLPLHSSYPKYSRDRNFPELRSKTKCLEPYRLLVQTFLSDAGSVSDLGTQVSESQKYFI